MIPKGTILIIGGAEDKKDNDTHMQSSNKLYEKFELLKDLLPNGNKKRIEIITTASADPEGMKRTYVNAFKKIGFTNVGYMAIPDKLHAKDEKVCERVEKAHAVFFMGGDQFKLAECVYNDKLQGIGPPPFTDMDKDSKLEFGGFDLTEFYDSKDSMYYNPSRYYEISNGNIKFDSNLTRTMDKKINGLYLKNPIDKDGNCCIVIKKPTKQSIR